MERERDKIGRTIAAFFVSAFLISLLSIFVVPTPANDQAETALQSASISSVFPNGDEAGFPIFFIIVLLPLAFSVLYALGLQWSGRFFVTCFVAYILSPVFFNLGGVELYGSFDILSEDILCALGGMLCFQIATFERNAVTARRKEADVGA